MTWALGRKGPEAAVRNGRSMEHRTSVQRTGTHVWGWGTGEQWLRLRLAWQEGINTFLGTPWGAMKINYRAVVALEKKIPLLTVRPEWRGKTWKKGDQSEG